MEALSHRKRVRYDDSAEFTPDTEFDSPKVKRIRDDLLSLLDDSDAFPDRDPAIQDLDSVIRSFEEEISGSGTRSGPESANFVDLTSDSGDSLTEQVQLLGDGTELVRVSSDSSGIGGFWDFQDELPSYDSFEFGTDCYVENTGYTGNSDDHEYVTLEGIFDYSDFNIGSDLSWRPETLPAL